MTSTEPGTKNLADLYDLAPLSWGDVRERLATKLTQAPGSGGPYHHTFWLSTLDADGRPHMTAVGAFWDDVLLERIARIFAEGGWAPTVADGGFTHEYSAPSAGPPPWYVYEFTIEDAYAVMSEEPGGATRWTF